MVKRTLDIIFALTLLAIFAVPFIVLALVVKLTSKGPILHWSKRVGKRNHYFLMPKFRSMRVETPQVATHLLENPNMYLTKIGSFLRKSSLDELPQLYSVLLGHMSFVGPRPALYNQYDLINLRSELNIHLLRPGLTGWAQINGRDDLPIPTKVELDRYYFQHKGLCLDIKIIFLTIFRVFRAKGISH